MHSMWNTWTDGYMKGNIHGYTGDVQRTHYLFTIVLLQLLVYSYTCILNVCLDCDEMMATIQSVIYNIDDLGLLLLLFISCAFNVLCCTTNYRRTCHNM